MAGYLQDFLFTPDRLRLPVKVLSGGERNRLLLAKLFTRPSNVLVLDEPTNDLDAETLDLLEELIADYSGTVLVVSHDRSFLDNLVTSVIALEGDGMAHEYVGAYTDWLRQRSTPAQERKPGKKNPPAQTSAPPRTSLADAALRNSGNLNNWARSWKPCRSAWTLWSSEQKTLEATLADPELFSRDPEAFAKTYRPAGGAGNRADRTAATLGICGAAPARVGRTGRIGHTPASVSRMYGATPCMRLKVFFELNSLPFTGLHSFWV